MPRPDFIEPLEPSERRNINRSSPQCACLQFYISTFLCSGAIPLLQLELTLAECLHGVITGSKKRYTAFALLRFCCVYFQATPFSSFKYILIERHLEQPAWSRNEAKLICLINCKAVCSS